jgi:phenylpropionate dioxygenase-like ring-hydroxylating dioxygenase large terminal subunit
VTIDVIPAEQSTEAPVAPSTGVIAAGTWFIAARSDELRAVGPIARAVNGTPLVLYRDAARRVVAMEDRCPHKNVALSLGRVCGDTLQCRYHGWRFDPAGAVVDVPCHAPAERLPACRVPTFRAVEQDDWIWVHVGEPEIAASAPPPPRYERSERYGWFELQNVIHAPVDLILENGLDCSHTGFAHEGLFRSAPTQFIRARIEETATGVRVETRGEDATGAKDVRSVLGRNKAIRHVDEVILPHTLKVDYWIGDATHVVTILVCTPEDGMRTRVYTRMGVSDGWLTPLVTRYVRRITRKVVAQDIAILNSQAARIREFGRREFRGVTADLPAVWMQRAYRRFAEGRYPEATLRSRDVTYKL